LQKGEINMIIDDIRRDMFDAKKNKDMLKANLLSTLFSEMFNLTKSGKPYSEEDFTKIVKKFVKNIDETVALDIPAEKKDNLIKEKVILESYLPKQLSKDEIEKIVTEMLGSGKQMKDIMQFFKENYAGMYDGRTVNEMIRSKQ
jgi:uncharacterized protein